MPIGSVLNQFPPAFFLVVHLAAFLAAAYFASRSFNGQKRALGWGFTLYALAEISYMTYHLDWTVFLFAHTISEVLDLAAFALIFVGVTRHVTSPSLTAARQATVG
ncbi:MAG: hypothetical protein EPO16_00870 [Dehalococcoidia bacterium]|nr:MAG: hypothetical protein EPO16_00870 [Dehalococcoidia bacterium]